MENRGHPGDFSGLAGARWQRIMHVEQPNPRALPTRPVIPVEVEVVLVMVELQRAGRRREREEAERRGRRRKGFDRTGPMDRYSSRIEEIPARP